MVTVSGDPSIAERYAAIRKQFKEQSSNDKVSEPIPFETVIDEFEAEYSDEDLRQDIDGDIRYKLVQRIEDQAKLFEFRYQTARYRSNAQAEWNSRHPDAKILVWHHKDNYYYGNGPRGVIYLKRGWPGETDSKCVIFDKATGEDVTENVFARYAEIEYRQEQIRNYDCVIVQRVNSQRSQTGDDRFDAWLTQKWNSTHNKRYNPDRYKSPRQMSDLGSEFSNETHYYEQLDADIAAGRIELTPGEQLTRSKLESAYNDAVDNLTHIMREYGIGDWDIRDGNWRFADCLLIIEHGFPSWRDYLREHPVSNPTYW